MIRISIIWGLRRVSLFSLWVALELNLMAFLGLILFSSFNRSNPIQYFLVQRLGSALMLFRVLALRFGEGQRGRVRIYHILVLLGLRGALKLGVAPFQGWLLTFSENLRWELFFFLRRLQKILPLYLFSQLPLSWGVVYLIVGSNLLVRLTCAAREPSLKRFLVLSSLLALAWIIARIYLKVGIFLYLGAYSWGIWGLSLFFSFLGAEGRNRLENSRLRLGPAILLLALFLQLAGFPPMVRFYAKLLILSVTLKGGIGFLRMSLVLAAGIFLYFYLRLCFPQLINFQKSQFYWNTRIPRSYGCFILIGRFFLLIMLGVSWKLRILSSTR